MNQVGDDDCDECIELIMYMFFFIRATTFQLFSISLLTMHCMCCVGKSPPIKIMVFLS